MKCLSVIIGDFYTFYRFYLCRYFGVDVEVLCRVYICFEFHFYIRDFQSGYIGYFTGLGFETSCIRLKVGSEVVYHDGIDSVDIFGNIIGAVVITMLPEVLRFLGDYYQITYCILVLLSALFLPNGLISIYGKVVRLFKKKTAVKGGEGCE